MVVAIISTLFFVLLNVATNTSTNETSPLPHWRVNFENETINTGVEETLTLTLDKGKIGYRPERLGKVLYCLPNQPCLKTQLQWSGEGFKYIS